MNYTDLLNQIPLSIIGAAFGSLATFVLPILIQTSKYKKRREFLGKWDSSYQQYQNKGKDGEWIEEQIVIGIRRGKLHIQSTNNPIDDHYWAQGQIVDHCIIGSWHSSLEGGLATGGFVLTILPMGKIMYGCFSGPRDSGEKIFGAWILARNKEDLARGKDLLAKYSLPKIN